MSEMADCEMLRYNHKDILEPPVLIILVGVNLFLYVTYSKHFDFSWICDGWFSNLWPFNIQYATRLNQLGVDSRKSCYVISSLSINFTIFMFSFIIAFVNKVRSKWFKSDIVVEGSWPLKASIFLACMIGFTKWYNFSHDMSLSSLNVDRSIWISILILTANMAVMVSILLHLAVHSFRKYYHKTHKTPNKNTDGMND